MTYCRRCEHLLLKPTPEAEAENIHRLFSQLRPAARGPGWLWTGRTNADGYGLMLPVGGVPGRHEWLPHRVMFGLFAPQPWHRVTEVIDHRDHDRLNTAIFNLEPVSRAENRRRRDRPPRGPLQRMWSYPAALLAHAHGLPVPDNLPTLFDLFGVPEPPAITDADDAEVVVPLTRKPVEAGPLAA